MQILCSTLMLALTWVGADPRVRGNGTAVGSEISVSSENSTEPAQAGRDKQLSWDLMNTTLLFQPWTGDSERPSRRTRLLWDLEKRELLPPCRHWPCSILEILVCAVNLCAGVVTQLVSLAQRCKACSGLALPPHAAPSQPDPWKPSSSGL